MTRFDFDVIGDTPIPPKRPPELVPEKSATPEEGRARATPPGPASAEAREDAA